MPCLTHVFTPEELESLDEKQLRILDEAIIRELQTNDQIKAILERKFKGAGSLHERFKTQSGRGQSER
jgi:hypothetical protein